MARSWETTQVLIVVRTYPVPAVKGAEVSCSAAITEQNQWLRLFPIPYRFLDPDKRFRKYQWIEVRVSKARNDPRPESYTLERDSIKVVSKVPPNQNWRARKNLVLPLRSHSLCELKRKRDRDKYPTLGLFRPKVIKRLIIAPDRADWTPAERAKLEQPRLFGGGPKALLEKIPLKFSYEFACEDSNCPDHALSCVDWEMANRGEVGNGCMVRIGSRSFGNGTRMK